LKCINESREPLIKGSWIKFNIIEIVNTPNGRINNHWGYSKIDIFSELLDANNFAKNQNKLEKEVILVLLNRQ